MRTNLEQNCESLTQMLHITDALEVSGGVKQLLLLMERLRSRILEQFLVCPPGRVAQVFKQKGFPVTCVSMFQDYDFLAVFKILAAIKQHNISLVHAHHPKAHALALIARHFRSFNLIVSRRVTHRIPWYPTSRWKYGSRFIDRFICVSEAVKKELARIGVDPEKLVVISSSTDFDRFKPCEPDPRILQELCSQLTTYGSQPLLIGMVANYSPWKGQCLFLEALRLAAGDLRETNLKVILAGRDTDSGAIRKKIKDFRLEDKVLTLGWRNDVEKILTVLDALVCPSLKGEGSSGAIREAFAMKVPVIASDIEANRELVNEKTGWLFASGNARALALALADFVKAPLQVKEARTQNGFSFVREKFSVEAMANQTFALYQSLASS